MKYVTVLTECASQLDRKPIKLFGTEIHKNLGKKNPRDIDIHTSVAVLVATTTTIGTNIKDTSNNIDNNKYKNYKKYQAQERGTTPEKLTTKTMQHHSSTTAKK
jgi:hypothetical protein